MKIVIGIVLIGIGLISVFFDLSWANVVINNLNDFVAGIKHLNIILLLLFVIAGVAVLLPYKKLKVVIKSITKAITQVNKPFALKSIITTGFICLFIIYIIQNQMKIDITGLGFLLLSLIPWSTRILKSAKLPGGLEIEFKDIAEAQKLVESVPKDFKITKHKYSFLNILGIDPNIAMAALRVEIETRLREIGSFYGFSEYEPLTSLFRSLRKNESITEQEFYGMEELIHVGNKAAHGAKVEDKIIKWATDYAPVILGILDSKISEIKKTSKIKKENRA